MCAHAWAEYHGVCRVQLARILCLTRQSEESNPGSWAWWQVFLHGSGEMVHQVKAPGHVLSNPGSPLSGIIERTVIKNSLPSSPFEGANLTFLLLFYVYEYCVCMCVHVLYVNGDLGGQKTVSDPFELELQTTV